MIEIMFCNRCFHCISTVFQATGMKPFTAIFQVENFELDHETGLTYRIEEGSKALQNLVVMHWQLVGRVWQWIDRAKRNKEDVYDVGEGVIV